MSTKIFNAYELVGHDLGSAVALLQQFKMETLRPLADQLKAKVLAKHAVERFDRITLGWETETGNPVSRAWRAMREQQQRAATGLREPDVDFGFELALIAHDGKVYAILYTEQEAFQTAWCAVPNVVSRSYWDSEDRPDEVSRKEWAARKKLWDAVFTDTIATPDDAGLAIKLLSTEGTPFAPEQDAVMAQMPTLSKRVKRLAMEAAGKALVDTGELENTISAYLSIHKHPRYPEVLASLERSLVPDVTWAMLTGESPAGPAEEVATPTA